MTYKTQSNILNRVCLYVNSKVLNAMFSSFFYSLVDDDYN